MPHDALKGMIMSTSGIGIMPRPESVRFKLSAKFKNHHDRKYGDHGTALMALREGINFAKPRSSLMWSL